MSIPFSNITTKKGLIQEIESELGLDDGTITNNTTLFKKITASINLALDDYTAIAIESSGTWQFDDSNHEDYPIIRANINSGQRDYAFTTDENLNLILDIYKVLILPSATSTIYQEAFPIDELEQPYDILTENTATGSPDRYGKLANGVFLDPMPGYNATSGIKVVINREGSYFTTSDTTKMPGVPGIHHKYFVLKPALDYARRNSLASFNRLHDEVVSYEGDEEKGIIGSIAKYFGQREKDVRHLLENEPIQYE